MEFTSHFLNDLFYSIYLGVVLDISYNQLISFITLILMSCFLGAILLVSLLVYSAKRCFRQFVLSIPAQTRILSRLATTKQENSTIGRNT